MTALGDLIRTDWMYDVRSACQTFYGLAYGAERAAVKDAFTWLREALSPPASVQEAHALDDLLFGCCTRVGTTFHATYHRTTLPNCSGSPVEVALSAWAVSSADPLRRLEAWTQAFWSFMDTSHPLPPAERVAAMLARSFREPPSLNALARHAGSSRRALTRDFRARYGMPTSEYVTRLRLRSFVNLVVDGTTAEEAARAAGYPRYHNLLDAARRRGLPVPSALRNLSYDGVRTLIDERLPLAVIARGRRQV